IKKNRIDLFLMDEVLNIHCLCGLQINAFKVFILKHDVFPLLVLVTFDDFVPRNFLSVLFGDTLVVYRTQIAFAQQAKLQLLPSRGGIESDWNVNETEADAAFPDGARHKTLIRAAARKCPPNCCHVERSRLPRHSFMRRLGDISVLNPTPAPKRSFEIPRLRSG